MTRSGRASVGGGLVHLRDDGLTRYDHTDGLASDAVYSVLVAKNGDVWAGTASGACRLREGKFRCWNEKDDLVSGRIVRLGQDAQEHIWFASVTDGVSVFDGNQMRSFGPDDGYVDSGATTLLADPAHNMLIGTLAGTYYRGNLDGMSPLEEPTPPVELKPFNALRDGEGNVLISMLGGIWQLQPTLRRLDDDAVDIGYVTDLLEDSDGQLWAATSTGLYQYSAEPFTPYGNAEGVANQTFVVAASPDGSVWAGTEADGAFNVHPDGRVQQYTVDDGLPINAVSSIMVDADGSVWLGTFGGGLAVVRENRVVRTLTTDDGLVGNQIGSLYRDRVGNLWVGTDAGLNYLTGYDVTATLTEKDGLLANQVRDVREDADGRLLVSGDNGLTIISLESLTVVDRFDQSKGLTNYAIATTYVDDRGIVWIGGRSGGLMRMDGEKWFHFGPEHNVNQTSVMTIVEDDDGQLWLGGRDGISRIPRSDLDAVALGERARVHNRTFSTNDGLRATRVSGGYQSASALTRDGLLWFATTGGLAAIEPTRLQSDELPQNISIEAVRADGVTIASSGIAPYQIPAGTESVQIDYTVPSINAAESLQFHYRLGDGRWQSANQRRTAFFNSLPPRNTSFEVTVRDARDAGLTSADRGTRIALYVEPLWYQTHLVRGLALVAFFLVLWAGHRLTLRYHRQRQRRLEKLVDERTAALQEALSEVRAMSRIDRLTGIANRRYFEERLAETWSHAIRHEQRVGIMMIDIDHFKKFNDAAGHQEGDRCLKLVAQALQSTLREEDFVARYGGEEFAVVLSSADPEKMWRIAARLQEGVRTLALPHPGLTEGALVTLSAGFATAMPVSGDNPENLIRIADEALYRAKEQGRDRIVIDRSGEEKNLGISGVV
ncbi:MAG: diguanylate cyclase [Gammaproteobacteria bacterium]